MGGLVKHSIVTILTYIVTILTHNAYSSCFISLSSASDVVKEVKERYVLTHSPTHPLSYLIYLILFQYASGGGSVPSVRGALRCHCSHQRSQQKIPTSMSLTVFMNYDTPIIKSEQIIIIIIIIE